jgi:fused signal recognition particle receptor
MSIFDSSTIGDDEWDELEELLISADVGISTTEQLIKTVKKRMAEERLDSSQLRSVMQEEIVNILKLAPSPLANQVKPPKIVLVVGVNGSGKTTSIAKLAYKLKREKHSVILAAADTFRAAAIDQLKKQGERVGVDVIAHQTGADPGAVVYDAMQAAINRKQDYLLVDTAGRLHTKYNLMEELKKIKRVITKIDETAPHEVLLVLDATTGQNGLTQAKYFAEAVGVTGIMLAKLDGTAKGGIMLAISDELRIPIQLIGTGEGLEDLMSFDPVTFAEALCS